MIYDEKLLAIDDQVELLCETLLAGKDFQNYQEKKRIMQQAGDFSPLQQKFAAEKERFEKVAAYGNYSPDFRQAQLAVRKAKRQLDLFEPVADFRVAETQLQTTLDEIGQALAKSISPTIKVAAGNPFFETGEKAGCRGNCHAS